MRRLRRASTAISIIFLTILGLSTPLMAGHRARGQFISPTNEIVLDGHHIVNMLDDFLAFYDQAKGKSLGRQRQMWTRMIQNKYSDYFERGVFRNTDPDTRLEMVDEFLSTLPQRIESIRQFNQTATDTVIDAVLSFKAHFPEYRQQRDIYIGLSLLAFDGSVRSVGNEIGIPDTLCLGADSLASYSRDQVEIVVAHELFHLYHFRYLLGSALSLAGRGLVLHPEVFARLLSAHIPLMVEGMAVAASELVFPGRPAGLYLHLSEDELGDQRANLADNAQAFLNMMRGGALPSQYERWFTGQYDGIPRRGGYLLGYEVTQRIMAEMPLDQMVRLKPAELGQEAEAQLSAIVTSGIVLMAARQ